MIAAQASGVPVAWLVARAAGLVAFGLLTISAVLGLALSTRILGGRRGKMLFGWHQTLMWAAFGMIVLHGGARTRPDYPLRPRRRSGARRCAVAACACRGRHRHGVAGRPSAASFNVRRRIGQRRWRLLHYATFGAFAIGLYHALNVGTDMTGTRGLILAGICLAPVVWLVYARMLMPRAQPRKPHLHALTCPLSP